MECFIQFTSQNADRIRDQRMEARKEVLTQDSFPIAWKLDRNTHVNIPFKGYQAARKPSEVSGLPRLYYDRQKPFEKTVPFYNSYVPNLFVQKPKAYIIPQGWWKVVELLSLNGVMMRPLKKDSTLEVEVYHIDDFKSSPRPYEMHHPNSDLVLGKSTRLMAFRKGDWVIPMDQPANRFILEVLEPKGEDSYFTWNFFDAILGQKEGYSHYVFEDLAASYLGSHPEIREKLNQRKTLDSAFARNGAAQLDFVFKNSPYYEPDHLRYPVYRLIK
jgi:hypothetical protein